MKKRLSHIVVLLALLLTAASCSNYQKLLKSNDVQQKYAAAVKYYEKGDYYRASELLDAVAPLLTGTEQAEDALFYQASSNFELGNYLLSETYFRNFYTTYPRSPKAEKAMFMQVKSSYNQSPDYEQDQASTLIAMESVQEFMIRYPESEYTEEANKILENLSIKLDRKAFDSAKLYYKIRYYKAAVVALDNFIKEYPSSPYAEEAAYMKIESQYEYAKESVPSKQEERYYEVVDFYQTFADQYPESEFMRSANQFYDNTLAELERIKSEKSTQANS
ncbi:outer membrane protein assembly factor BamD [Pontibacter sp. BT310]|jgi:outer membrane protein assembly factor BamD|uniref:Outer membrane protein assembly factor BamD n=1 Tax=Pontibacter populi TaxID=890055 RepID=A0ABS6X6V8_9BACT|nr:MULTISPECIES: outer membrane protein assembly factor BamD [Pontibacter]MBJ6116881.1 outer membrane protein assembly factor BamD [Pontibacter sp. BT310]MBR0569305.1 outer membrane protein assembly factor BamD [Microvirga sp. STS03]MBW3363734.1 outer membrane protein assembly factor BamD [Pontibacter populi]